jgi:hypothetical protein
LSPVFWASVLVVAVGVVFAASSAWRAPRFGQRRTISYLVGALLMPLVALPVLSLILSVVFRYTTTTGGDNVQAPGLLNAMLIEFSAGFLAALSLMPYYAAVIAALALFVVVRHGLARAAEGEEDEGF